MVASSAIGILVHRHNNAVATLLPGSTSVAAGATIEAVAIQPYTPAETIGETSHAVTGTCDCILQESRRACRALAIASVGVLNVRRRAGHRYAFATARGGVNLFYGRTVHIARTTAVVGAGGATLGRVRGVLNIGLALLPRLAYILITPSESNLQLAIIEAGALWLTGPRQLTAYVQALFICLLSDHRAV